MAGYLFNLPSDEQILNGPNGRLVMQLIGATLANQAFLISGPPGSGKSTVAVIRFIRQLRGGKKLAMLSFQNLLVAAIKGLVRREQFPVGVGMIDTLHTYYHTRTKKMLNFSNSSEPSAEEICEMLKKAEFKPEELIIDETQDLSERIVAGFVSSCTNVVCLADNDQQLRSNDGTNIRTISKLLETTNRAVSEHKLQYNYRNTYSVYAFAKQFIHTQGSTFANDPGMLRELVDKQKQAELTGNYEDKPLLIFYSSKELARDQVLAQITNNLASTNIGILLHNQDNATKWSKFLSKNDIEHTFYINGTDKTQLTELKSVIVTTFIGAKGLEFDMVIMPLLHEISSDKIDADMERSLYVACTRAKKRLFLYFNDSSTPILTHFTLNPDTYEVISI